MGLLDGNNGAAPRPMRGGIFGVRMGIEADPGTDIDDEFKTGAYGYADQQASAAFDDPNSREWLRTRNQYINDLFRQYRESGGQLSIQDIIGQ